jgi:hypothetical protein
MKAVLTFFVVLNCVMGAHAADERIWWPGVKINGHTARIAFDSGAASSVFIFSTGMQRLGLKMAAPQSTNQSPADSSANQFTAVCKFELGDNKFETSAQVIQVPGFFNELDGVFGWPLFGRNNLFQIDALRSNIRLLQNVPAGKGWTKIALVTNSPLLDLKMSAASGSPIVVGVDTGNPGGIKLAPEMWREWKRQHPEAPLTLNAYFTPNLGLVVGEESWARDLSIGDLKFHDVPVGEADANDVELGTFPGMQFQATLGLGALKRMEIVIDGVRGNAYVRPARGRAPSYKHNRLGAVFVPHDLQSDDLFAHVVPGSPADQAGIRGGDILIKEGNVDVTNWRQTNMKVNALFREQRAGTRVQLTLKRGGKIFTASVVLRNLLPPDKRLN